MALSFPLSLPDFQLKLKISSMSMYIEEYDEVSGTGRGDVLTSQIAFPKWRAEVNLSPRYHSDAAETRALLAALGSRNTFMMFDTSRQHPIADPGSALLGSSPVEIHDLGSNNRSIRLRNLPAGYVLSAGDLLQFSLGDRNALHRIVETVTANGAGTSSMFEVRPHLKPWAVVGRSVRLRRAYGVFQLTASNVGSSATRVTDGMSFSAIEAY